jgi:hemerythrin-like metal-binding protein
MAAPLIAWGPNFELGVPEIDRQHKELVNIINRLAAAMQQGTGTAIVGKILQEVVSYAQMHFSDEEKLMVRSRYQEHAAHHHTHEDLLKTVRALQTTDASALRVTLETLKFLRAWLTEHIQKSDREFAQYLRTTGQVAG